MPNHGGELGMIWWHGTPAIAMILVLANDACTVT
jgi:hypothetical protein